MAEKTSTAKITLKPFGITSSNEEVILYTLENETGMRVAISNYGGIVTECWVKDRQGEYKDVVLGYNDVSKYEENSPYFGAIIGRFGNRIAGASFTLNGEKYELAHSSPDGEMPIQLHGGISGFDKKVWEATPSIRSGEAVLELRYISVDGEEGFPGNLDVVVTYTLTNQDELKIEYFAQTDKATPVNLTNHSYFNLKGEGEGDILDHVAKIKSKQITDADVKLLPTGKFLDVEGTPFDFNQPTVIGERIDDDFQPLVNGGGYDHNYVLDIPEGSIALVAEVFEPESGRVMEVLTEEPGVQFYCGNFLEESCVGKQGKAYVKRGGFCLETQHYPDSVNQDHFPSTILNPGEVYETTTIYRFKTR